MATATRGEAAMLNLIEKLINEHGSSAILKERLGLIQAQYTALEGKCRDLEAENQALRSEIAEHEVQAKVATQVAGKAVFCSHCGSSNLKRNGSRPDKTFGDLGIDRILFSCLECGQPSDFLSH